MEGTACEAAPHLKVGLDKICSGFDILAIWAYYTWGTARRQGRSMHGGAMDIHVSPLVFIKRSSMHPRSLPAFSPSYLFDTLLGLVLVPRACCPEVSCIVILITGQFAQACSKFTHCWLITCFSLIMELQAEPDSAEAVVQMHFFAITSPRTTHRANSIF
jgi:hypothetical protein